LPGKKETIRKVAKKLRYSRYQPTKKPDLSEDQEYTRYIIAFDRIPWTLDNYKVIAYSDEASIRVGEHRGDSTLSRKPEEKYNNDCISPAFAQFSVAMFWGACTYNSKCKSLLPLLYPSFLTLALGPGYIYLKETKEQTLRYKAILDTYNTQVLPEILRQ